MKKFLSCIMNLLTSIRNFLYDHQLLSIKTIRVPIVSIGNLELGGTGKTPIVIYLCQLLKKNNLKPGIISRGYKRQSKGRQVVSDGKIVFLNPEFAGDEPFLLATLTKNIPIIADKNRSSASNFLINNFDVNVILLDDAFQHRKINRSVDIVLLNINTPASKLKVFPLGFLRESIKSIYRADILLITKQNNFTNQKNIDFINNFYFHHKFFTKSCFALYDPILNKEIKATDLEPVFAFCGIGDPFYFKNTIKSLNIDIALFKKYKDHQKYDPYILKEIKTLTLKNNIKNIITTEKDFIKLPLNFCKTFSVKILKMSFKLDNQFDQLILKML